MIKFRFPELISRRIKMDRKRHDHFDGKLIFGLIIISIGFILLLRNWGVIPHFNLWDFWPVILIFIGIGHLNRPANERSLVGGLIFLGLGIFFLANNLHFIYFQFRDIWPIILILIGIYILKKAFWIKGDSSTKNSDHDIIDLSLVLGGGDFKYSSQNIKGGHIVAIMGGGTVDLRQADIKEESISLEIFACMGGVELKVPVDWHVVIKGIPFLGGMDNSTNPTVKNNGDISQKKKSLIIKGMAIMGGIEVKN
jgi:predicted membrane protein